jgi:hypothetical protein
MLSDNILPGNIGMQKFDISSGFRFQVFQQLLYGTDEADGIYNDTVLNTCGNDAVKEKIANASFFNLGKAGGNLT